MTGRGLQYLFRTNPTAEDMGRMIVEMVVEKVAPGLGREPGDLKIGILHEDSSYGTSVAGHQERFGAEAGLNIVTTQAYPASTVDLSSTVLDFKQRGVDVVFQTSYQNDSVLFLQQANEAGFTPAAIFGGGGGYSLQPTADAVGHDIIDGVLSTDFTQYIVNTEFTPGLDEFLGAYARNTTRIRARGIRSTTTWARRRSFRRSMRVTGSSPTRSSRRCRRSTFPRATRRRGMA